jgi:hypothetical protein
VRCPLCRGPVHQNEDGFECQVGHKVDAETLRDFTDAELAEALWMAIDALDSEVVVRRALGQDRFADQAERQAQALRDFARLHTDEIDAS